jgi:putative ABC transport system ATP-binding protein
MIIELKDVKKEYVAGGEKIEALKGVNISINRGDFVAITGSSGSGKTTLLSIMGCMETATEGDVRIGNRDVDTYSDREKSLLRANYISFVFQNFALMDKYTAYENIELPLLNAGVKRRERKKRIHWAAEQLGIKDQLEKRPREMSGGQQQRVAIARALASSPQVILADEPTGALDVDNTKKIMEILTDINKCGTAVVVVTHEKEVAAYAKRTIRMEDGCIV